MVIYAMRKVAFSAAKEVNTGRVGAGKHLSNSAMLPDAGARRLKGLASDSRPPAYEAKRLKLGKQLLPTWKQGSPAGLDNRRKV